MTEQEEEYQQWKQNGKGMYSLENEVIKVMIQSIKEEIEESLAPVSMPSQRLDEFCKRVAYRLIKNMEK